MSSAPSIAAGTLLGEYELLRYLASGGMAEIYLARKTGIEGFEKIVVLKRMLPGLAADTELVRLFLHEARLAATLHHPNVAQVYDVGIADGQYFFAMEYVHGEDLRAIMKLLSVAGRRPPLAEMINIAIGASAALHYAHESKTSDGRAAGIVHCDVSPSNIIISFDGTTKLVDFGVARATLQSRDKTDQSLRGKIPYMSPEQCDSLKLDRRSDIFSLGIVLYECTTGTRLFAGTSPFATMVEIVNGNYELPSRRVSNYPPRLEQLVMKALATDPNDRYATAQELQLELESFALDARLAISSVPLSRFLHELVADKSTAWRDAQEDGTSLDEHLLHTIHTSTSVQPPSPEPVPPFAPLSTEVSGTMDIGVHAARMQRLWLALGVSLLVGVFSTVWVMHAQRLRDAAPPVSTPAHVVPPVASPAKPSAPELTTKPVTPLMKPVGVTTPKHRPAKEPAHKRDFLPAF